MDKEVTVKIRNYFKKVWFYHIIVGLIFLMYSASVITTNGAMLKNVLMVLGCLFLLTGIGNVIYSFSGINSIRFHWGEMLFWGVVEILSGWIILSKKLEIFEVFLLETVGEAVRKATTAELDLKGYLIVFYIGTFLIFRGISHIVTKMYDQGTSKQKYIFIIEKWLLILDGFLDLIFGIGIVISAYLAPELFNYILFLYITFSSIILILFGWSLKYSTKESEEVSENEESQLK
ncbi:hypothetical protein H5J22_03575 [Cetobacterium sp. 8H]|uniref:hypothetical protein n=1 Tax=Cetobacterium sp. 8H TaxID=2759681 RepID=UPI00163CF5CA|nr:hypothetical protein [Cetobacterium sp. 8H]MBC2850521.1 hypothetical protein [Cetobacterium sp. 8H]